MTKINLSFDIDLNNFDPEDGDFVDYLEREVVSNIATKIKAAVVEQTKQELDKTVNNTIADTIKHLTEEKMKSFLTAKITISDKWGKPSFVGSVDDLLKREFDNCFLYIVDQNGKRLEKHSYTENTYSTYVQWLIANKINNALDSHLQRTVLEAEKKLRCFINETFELHTNKSVKQKIATTIEAFFVSAPAHAPED